MSYSNEDFSHYFAAIKRTIIDVCGVKSDPTDFKSNMIRLLYDLGYEECDLVLLHVVNSLQFLTNIEK